MVTILIHYCILILLEIFRFVAAKELSVASFQQQTIIAAMQGNLTL
jgi:hypothetical protein